MICIHDIVVDLFLDEISECLGKDAVLLTLTPKTIEGKNVNSLFSEYVPRKSRFVEVLIINFLLHGFAILCSTAMGNINSKEFIDQFCNCEIQSCIQDFFWRGKNFHRGGVDIITREACKKFFPSI